MRVNTTFIGTGIAWDTGADVNVKAATEADTQKNGGGASALPECASEECATAVV